MSEPPDDPLLTTISMAEWLKIKSAYGYLRGALCAIEILAETDEAAQKIARAALAATPANI